MADKRVRLVRVTVSPEFVVDDGETLTPLPVQQAVIPGSGWGEFATDGFAHALAQLTEQVNAPEPTSD